MASRVRCFGLGSCSAKTKSSLFALFALLIVQIIFYLLLIIIGLQGKGEQKARDFCPFFCIRGLICNLGSLCARVANRPNGYIMRRARIILRKWGAEKWADCPPGPDGRERGIGLPSGLPLGLPASRLPGRATSSAARAVRQPPRQARWSRHRLAAPPANSFAADSFSP